MSVRLGACLLFTTAVSLGAGGAVAQVAPRAPDPLAPRPAATAPARAPVAQPPVTPGAAAPVATQPAQGEPVQPVPPPPLPPAIWDVPNAQVLYLYIQQIGREGLNPSDYDPEGLYAALRSGGW